MEEPVYFISGISSEDDMVKINMALTNNKWKFNVLLGVVLFIVGIVLQVLQAVKQWDELSAYGVFLICVGLFVGVIGYRISPKMMRKMYREIPKISYYEYHFYDDKVVTKSIGELIVSETTYKYGFFKKIAKVEDDFYVLLTKDNRFLALKGAQAEAIYTFVKSKMPVDENIKPTLR